MTAPPPARLELAQCYCCEGHLNFAEFGLGNKFGKRPKSYENTHLTSAHLYRSPNDYSVNILVQRGTSIWNFRHKREVIPRQRCIGTTLRSQAVFKQSDKQVSPTASSILAWFSINRKENKQMITNRKFLLCKYPHG